MEYITDAIQILSILCFGLGTYAVIALACDALEARRNNNPKKRGATRIK